LVKHGPPEIDRNKPARDWPLAEAGRSACVRLAEQLPRFEPLALVSSLERKASQTADAIGGFLGLRPTLEPGLHEHQRSSAQWFGEPEWRALVERFFGEPDDLVMGDETATQALRRFSEATDRVLARSGGATTIVVSHGTVISLFAAARTGANGFALWEQLDLPSFMVLSLNPWRIERIYNL
jgi:broad specificity phosphatase PhoE